MSNSEEMLTAIINGESVIDEPQCRKEKFLKAIANNEGTTNLPVPNCREEALLYAIAEKGLSGGGGGSDEEPEKDMLQQMVDSIYSCSYLFYNYTGTKLDFISKLDTSKATAMRYMFAFSWLQSLDLSSFNTSKVTDMYHMFEKCTRLNSIDLSSFNTSKVTNMGSMFSNCNTITILDLSSFNTSNVTDMLQMFYNDYSLTKIIGALDLIKVTSLTSMFSLCTALTDVTLKNIKVKLTIGSGTSYGHLLSMDSLLNAIKELHDMTDSTAQTLTIGSANLEKLANTYVKLIDITDEMRTEDQYIDAKLPFEVCESTDEGALHIIDGYAPLKNWTIA